MFEHIGLMVLKGFQDRAEKLNDYLGELLGEKRNYIIDIDSPRFSNGEGKVQINETVRDKEIYIISDIGNYDVTYDLYGKENRMSPDDHFLDVIRAISAISGKARKITLFMPLMYSSRQHRRKGRESLDCAMALRYLETLGVKNILTFDIHDPEIQNTIPTGSFDSIFPMYSILKYFIKNEASAISKDKMVVISPDVGAMERTKRYASILNLDLGLYYKRRDYTRIVNGKNPILQHEYIGPDVKGKDLLIVDDMLSSGESIIDIVTRMKEKGCGDVYVITTFAFFTNGLDKFDELYEKGLIKKVYSTNASYLKPELKTRDWFCEIDLTKCMAKVITCLAQNKGISNILDSQKKLQTLLDKINKAWENFSGFCFTLQSKCNILFE